MGMFDYIKCKYPLPISGLNDINFQTKSLDNCLEQYEIREDGTLWREICRYEDHSDKSLQTLKRFAGACTRIHEGWELHTDACTICFYESVNNIWVEFKAQFVDGKLHKIEEITQKQK